MPAPANDLDTVRKLRDAHARLKGELAKVIVGQDEVIDQLLLAIFCRSHALLMGVPGLAKTLMVNTLAQALDLSFKRIQFTPDLMPSDITGSEVIQDDPATRQRMFKFLPGPLFANIVLADEINRTPPKTQAALLEAMQERRCSIGGVDHAMRDPFFVLATQNPIEQEGTYPLPEAQLDRFMFNVRVEYPSLDEEKRIINLTSKDEVAELQKVLSGKAIVNLQKLVRSVPVSEFVTDYVVKLVRATRPKDPSAPEFIRRMVDVGAGVRAGQYLVRAGQAFAAMDGRFSVAVDDIRRAALPVLRHRIGANFQAQAEGKTSDDIVADLLRAVAEAEPAKYVAAAAGKKR